MGKMRGHKGNGNNEELETLIDPKVSEDHTEKKSKAIFGKKKKKKDKDENKNTEKNPDHIKEQVIKNHAKKIIQNPEIKAKLKESGKLNGKKQAYTKELLDTNISELIKAKAKEISLDNIREEIRAIQKKRGQTQRSGGKHSS